MLMRALATLLLLALPLCAADPFTPWNRDLPMDSQYVPVSLASVANDSLPMAFPASVVAVKAIPFAVLTETGANHLNMLPIGWSAMTNETRKEYPGYYARYDFYPEPGDRSRAAFRIPVADYASAYVLAASDDDPARTTTLTLRFGRLGGGKRTEYHDFTATIPRAGDKTAKVNRDGVQQIIPTARGNLYLVRIPIARALAQDFQDAWAMHLDLTGELRIAINMPDPHRFQLRPIGDPSGVRIYGLTLERSSAQLTLTSSQPGNVFNLPEQPLFRATLRNHYATLQAGYQVLTRRDDGVEQTFTFPDERRGAGGTQVDKLVLPLTEPGWYDVRIRLVTSKGQVLAERLTTLALLAPDTRQHRATSPFGTWDFQGGHSTPNDPELIGPLAVKAGMKYAANLPEYGLESYRDLRLSKATVEKMVEQKKADPTFTGPKRGLIFHENSVSGPHVLRMPDVFSGKTYTLTENDQTRFKALWDEATAVFALMREHFPQTEIYFGNGMPHLIEEFCRQGLPKSDLRIAGNESGSFMRPPETQPPDLVANNGGIFMFRRILDHYGYTDTKVAQCFEMCYPNTNPGNLTLQTQAEFIPRHMLHSLAWRIPLIRLALLVDVKNSYYHSNWGASGLCFGAPNVSPKPSYIAYAVLTQQLDGASFTRQVETGSAAVYAFEFKRPDGTYMTCLWTLRGTREARVTTPGATSATLTSIYGRTSTVTAVAGALPLTIGTAVTYLPTAQPIASIALGATSYPPPPAGESFVISPLDSLAAWEVETGRNHELENYNFMCNRRQGNFAYDEAAALDGRERVVQVAAKLPVPGSEYLPMYSVMKLKQPVEIPGVPTEIGLWVHGNATWGRVVFELEDAGGQRWVSLGAEQSGEPNPWMADWLPKEQFEQMKASRKAGFSDWNSDDAWGRSTLNHDGWRYVKFPLPGHFGKDHNVYHWPYHSQWRWSGDGQVKYPLKFTRLAIVLPEKILYGNDWRPVTKPQIALSGLQVTYVPAEEAFVGE